MGFRRVVIVNERGLHARAAAKFSTAADNFPAEVTVSNGRDTVPGRSIMGLLMLGAAKGSEITIETAGDMAGEALDALCALVERGFDED